MQGMQRELSLEYHFRRSSGIWQFGKILISQLSSMVAQEIGYQQLVSVYKYHQLVPIRQNHKMIVPLPITATGTDNNSMGAPVKGKESRQNFFGDKMLTSRQMQ